MHNAARTSLLSLALLGLSAVAAYAQDEKPAIKTVVPSGRDPFHKERGAPTTVPDFADNLVSVTTIFESYSLKVEDAAVLLNSPPDANARYRRVMELLAAGKARLDDVQASASKPSVRGLIESVDMLGQPFQFTAPVDGDAAPLPSGFQNLQFGDRLEFEPILGGDGRACNLSFSLSSKRLLGITELRAGNRAQPQPSTTTDNREIITSVSLRVGEPALLGTRSQPPAQAGENADVSIVFGRVVVDKERPEAAQPPAGPVGYAEHLITFYSLDRAAAREILVADTKPGACFKLLQALIEKKQARLEHITSLPTQPGMRAKLDENIVAYGPAGSPQESPVRDNSKPLPGPNAAPPGGNPPKNPNPARPPYFPSMAGKNLGLSIELETTLGTADASLKGTPLIADVNLLVSWRTDAGNLKGAEVLKLYPDINVAESRKIQNYISCYAGIPTLLGTLNPPRDNGVNGRKDTGKTWLAFIQVTPVKP